ncbi:DUF397 domain-containing protein [Streptomyces tuirus]|uniref:DUF397 domain-containing protein n=1 Tax=Streptomyces tuirus TaxID=68278 RepID=A0A941J5R1_9ACTN|nr:DUF397 domain-containing protein [Streptomyces tuirus]
MAASTVGGAASTLATGAGKVPARAQLGGRLVPVRDSKAPQGPALCFETAVGRLHRRVEGRAPPSLRWPDPGCRPHCGFTGP